MSCARGCCETQAEHYRSVSFSATCTPTVRKDTADSIAREKRWERDMPAYKRLRENGTQPKRIDGSGDLEQVASSKTEIEHGRTMKGGGKRFQEVSDAYQAGQLEDVL